MKVWVYYEGDPRLRPGFRQLFRGFRDSARRAGGGIEFVAGEGTPWKSFYLGLSKHRDDRVLLLKDSEVVNFKPEKELAKSKFKFKAAHAKQIFWMVPCMESWFLSDPGLLDKCYGKSFQAAAIKQWPCVETFATKRILHILDAATSGRYHKTNGAPELLAGLNAGQLRKCAPNFEKLCSYLESIYRQPEKY